MGCWSFLLLKNFLRFSRSWRAPNGPEVALIHLRLQGNELVCSSFEVALSLFRSVHPLATNPLKLPRERFNYAVTFPARIGWKDIYG